VGQKRNGFWDDVVPVVDPERCRRCADCPPLAACPVQGLSRTSLEDVPVADKDFCLGCYSCADACPHNAIILPRAR
jgi:NAD-dependent dihydropyrimidine dehydrogenase PreA subunit